MFKISLIPTPYKILIGLVLLTVAAGGGAWLGSSVTDKDWQLKDGKRIEAAQKAKLDELAIKEQQQREQASRVAALDTKYQKELSDAKTENETLRRAVRAGSVRLSVKPAKPAAYNASDSTAASSADAQARCELDPATADDLISITSDGDAAIRQLNALQSYIVQLIGVK